MIVFNESRKKRYFCLTIISGGQTGVDRAALDAAIGLGYSYTGWLSKGRLAENGPLPDSHVGMKEMTPKNYIRRTEQNAVDSDFTIVICHGEPKGGTKRTIDFCVKHKKPYFYFDLDADRYQTLNAVWNFIDAQPISLTHSLANASTLPFLAHLNSRPSIATISTLAYRASPIRSSAAMGRISLDGERDGEPCRQTQ